MARDFALALPGDAARTTSISGRGTLALRRPAGGRFGLPYLVVEIRQSVCKERQEHSFGRAQGKLRR
jgi:hypothetical protein